MTFIPNCDVLNKTGIALMEKKYNAKFVMDSCLSAVGGGWCNFPAAIFYIKNRSAEDLKKYPDGSNYIAFYRRDGNWMITNGNSATERFEGLMLPNGNVIYSTYRHHFNMNNEFGVFVDGGRSYIRWGGNDDNIKNCKLVWCQLVDGEVKIENEDKNMTNLKTVDGFREALNNHIIEFTFVKTDGTLRNMVGTTNAAVIANKAPERNNKVSVTPDDLIKVFDIDKDDWRSFRFSRLSAFHVPKIVS